jgi:hypothetical protein
LNVETPPDGVSETDAFHERYGLQDGRMTHLACGEGYGAVRIIVALQEVPLSLRTRVDSRLHLIAERREALLPTAWRARAAGHPLELHVQQSSSGGELVHSGRDAFDAAVHVLSREPHATAAAVTPEVQDALLDLFTGGRPAGTLVAGGGLLRWTADEAVAAHDGRIDDLYRAFEGLAGLKAAQPV